MFCENPFFVQRPNLIVAILSLESRIGIKLPNTFHATMMPLYMIGERKVELGKIHNLYIFGMDFEDGHWEYRAFEDIREIKLFFAQMEDLEPTERAYWLNQIEEIPKK
jgi:hypothetical protein